MSVGRKQNITISVILNSIYEKTGLTGHQIGNIDIFDNFSDFYRFMGDTYIENKRAHIEPARPRDKSKKNNTRNNNRNFNKKRGRKSKKFNPHRNDYHQKDSYRKDTYRKESKFRKDNYGNESY